MSTNQHDDWMPSDTSWFNPWLLFMGAYLALFDDHKSPVKTGAIALIIAIGTYGCYRSWREQQRRERK